MLRLVLLSALEVLALVAVLLFYLQRIVTALERIGGPSDSSHQGSSTLAKVRWGVAAIDKETSYLGPEVTKLNGGLLTLADKLGVVEGHLARAARALGGEEAS